MALIDQLENVTIGPKSFSGGRNTEWSQDMGKERGDGGVLPNQLIMLQNFDVGSMGALIGRRGTNEMNSTAINSGARIRSIHFYTKASTGTKYCLVQTGTEIGTFNLTTGAWTQLATGISTISMRWVNWNDNAYAFNGTGIYKFDGTNWTQVQDSDADTPDSMDGTVLDDVLFTAWDTTSYPSRVPYSDAFDAEAWTATNFRRIREGDGQDIIGIDTVGNKILCRRSNSALWLHGSGIESFAEEFLSEEIGQIGRMTSAKRGGAVFFQGNRGIEYFYPGTPALFNNVTRDTCQSEILGYSRTIRDAAVAIYHQKTDRYLISYPDASTPIIFVFFANMPLLAPDGNMWFPHSTYTGLTVTAMAVDSEEGAEGKLYFGTDDGYVLEADYGYTDSGSVINGTLKWGYTNCEIPNQVKNFARVFIPARCTGGLQVTVDVDYLKKIKSKITPTYTPEGVGIWDSSSWDDCNWASENVGTRKARYTKMNGIRIAVQIKKDMNDLTEIHPFIVEYFPKEKVRWP